MEASAESFSYSSEVEVDFQDAMRDCVAHAVVGLCDMVGSTYQVVAFETCCASLMLLPGLVANPEADAVGVYLRAVGDFGGQLLMVMPYPMATDMVERMVGEPVQELGRIEMSALGEAGNLMSGYFLRELEHNSQLSSRPTPPVVLVDMLSTILESVAVANPEVDSPKILTHAAFQIPGKSDRADFWVVFDQEQPCSCEGE